MGRYEEYKVPEVVWREDPRLKDREMCLTAHVQYQRLIKGASTGITHCLLHYLRIFNLALVTVSLCTNASSKVSQQALHIVAIPHRHLKPTHL